ncbi:BLUF domain-containing protein [Microbacterium sp. EST19A]|uniref:BLUF domain-containing protein n=1 Tax=Microbacterium sp. EST19A TaxID=2862681 RepID=UPI001CC042A7|nr:BLUF domain-containing protein [Microbacterium sp. EST19A]
MSDTAPAAGHRVVYSTVYTSAATAPFDGDDLTRLLTQSRSANEARDVTGVLLYRQGRFVQYLEGDEATVRELVDRIGADPRHGGFRVLVDDEHESRYFPQWTMGFVSEEADALMPIGFRTAFNDIDVLDEDPAAAVRAFRQLSLMFRDRPGK